MSYGYVSRMRPAEGDTSDCILVVGLSRPKLAATFLTVALISLFFTFHVLYDSAIYNLNVAASIVENNQQEIIINTNSNIKNITINKYNNIIRNLIKINNNNNNHLDDDDDDNNNEVDLKMHNIGDESSKLNGDNRLPRMTRQLPQAIIIGVRKCGTRALLEMLFLHPRIQRAAGEVHFFDRDENYDKGLEWYRSKMPTSLNGQITIEKSPSYFVTPEVPERIHAMNASVKLLVIVREPVTRAISDYTQLKTHATSTPTLASSTTMGGTTIEELSSSSSSSSAGKSSSQLTRTFEELVLRADGSINESYRPISISLYHNYMHRWLEVFPREQILIVNGDQLIEDPVSQLTRIETFLGIESHIGKHNFYFNHTKGFYCLRNDTADRCLRESKGRRHPRVHPLVVSKLRKFFNEHNQRFYELVGEDFGWPEE